MKSTTMNLFNPPKFVKGVYLRQGDQAFIVLAQFVYNARRQHWSATDIEHVRCHALNGNYEHFMNIIQAHLI